ncbi:MAG: CDGSH iron-sulfur domain-containing protein [SAR324 cluster bacterium]|nr:CDGSH iron-sulfur domain-containing protein [SAR324 cluster bacterium]
MQKNDESGATIKIAKNGPYLVSGPVTVQREGQVTLETKRTTALCRCGQSAKKPYCDGTHSKVGFDGAETADRGDLRDKRVAYEGAELTIFDDRTICSHAAVCTDNLPSVWKLGEEPWIDPNGGETARIIAIVERCPSGALSYSLKAGGESDEKPRPAGITVLPDGPYALQGEVLLKSSDGEPWESRPRMTLCRCGASKNKPFCDGSHWNAGFKDP